MHRFVALAGTLVVVLGLVIGPARPANAAAAAAPRSGSTAWVYPVDGAVVRPFDQPRTRYGPGHRGVDFAAAPGTPVVAAGPGTVVFAGRIGPSSHVVVLHPSSGWRTGYSFLASVAVHVGELVAGGTVVGTSGGAGDGHDGSVLHFSLRIGDEYVDPMILFRPIDLATAVHLAPTAGDRSGMGFGAPPQRATVYASLRAAERLALVDGLRNPPPQRARRAAPWHRLVCCRFF